MLIKCLVSFMLGVLYANLLFGLDTYYGAENSPQKLAWKMVAASLLTICLILVARHV